MQLQQRDFGIPDASKGGSTVGGGDAGGGGASSSGFGRINIIIAASKNPPQQQREQQQHQQQQQQQKQLQGPSQLVQVKYECPLCDQLLPSINAARMHIDEHYPRDSPYCPVAECRKRFSHPNSVRNHMRTKHSRQWDIMKQIKWCL